MKRLYVWLLVGLVLLLLFSSSLFIVQRSLATPRTSGAATPYHPVVFPTRTEAQHLRTSTPAGPPYGQGDLLYHNGPVQENPRAFLIFWGPTWNNGSGGLTGDGQVVQNYFADVGSTAFENILTQYYDTAASIPYTLHVAGIWMDFATPPSDQTCGGPSIEDAAIQNEVNHAIAVNGWARDGANATYFVYAPNGYYVTAGADPNFCSDKTYCAYHSYSAVAQVAYATIPYPIDLNACGGLPTSPNGNIDGDTLVNMTSHEQFEAITDPQGTGWYDATGYGGEIGDKCAYDFSAGTTTLNNNGTFEVQTEYSNASHSCVNSLNANLARFQTSSTQVSLTTTPGTNPAPETLTLTNTGFVPLNWNASFLPAWIALDHRSGTLAPANSQTLTLTFNITSSTPQTYTTNLTLLSPNAVNPTVIIPVTVVVAAASKTWYFAEGYTGSGFTEYLTIANPNSVSANVQVTYLLGSGTPIVKSYPVTPDSRFTLNVNNEIGPNQNASLVVQSNQPIVAERPMYFTFTGLPGFSIPGGSDVLGATSLSQNFDFGYLDTTPGHGTFLTVLNQNNVTMNVTIQYFQAGGGSPLVRTHQVPAKSRGTVNVNADVPAGSYSALVTLDQPGLVERPMYLIDGQTHYTGAADVVGVAQPVTDWDFAEGYTSSTFEERYILSNPSTTLTAHASITFLESNGTTKQAMITLAPGVQQTVDANGILGLNVNNSAHVHANQPILAERFISFKYTGAVGNGQTANIPGASDVLGAPAPAHLFYFAEGYTGGSFGEYLTIENPDPTTPALVTVTYLPANGQAPLVVTYQAAPSSRYTVFTNHVMSSQSFSMVVESNVAVVVERPMYFNYNGITGGSDVVGYQPDGAALSTPGLNIYGSVMNTGQFSMDAQTAQIHWFFNQQFINDQSRPAVANGVDYFGSTNLYALDARTGAQIWTYPGAAPYADPTVVNGVVYYANPNVGTVYALNASTGALLWQNLLGGLMAPGQAVANGVVYVAVNSYVYALDAATGAALWWYNVIGVDFSTPTFSNGVVYAGANDSNLYALNAKDGSLLWKYQTGGAIAAAPFVNNGVVYIGSTDGNEYALNANSGAFLWKYQTGGAIDAAPALDNGVLLVGSEDSYLYALNASTGSLSWRYQTSVKIVSSPVAAMGVVFVGSVGGYVYALDDTTGSLYWSAYVNGGVLGGITLAP